MRWFGAAKKIPIEHILASSRGAGRSGAAGAGASGASGAGGNVNLDAAAQGKGKDACNC